MKKTTVKTLAGFMAAAAITASAFVPAFAEESNLKAPEKSAEINAGVKSIDSGDLKRGNYYVMEWRGTRGDWPEKERRIVKLVDKQMLFHYGKRKLIVLLCDKNEQAIVYSDQSVFYPYNSQQNGGFC